MLSLINFIIGFVFVWQIAATISAVNQDLRDFPPVLVEVGEAEILLDQILKFVEKLKEDAAKSTAPTYVECSVHKDMTHSFQMLYFTKMSQISESFAKMKSFIDRLDDLNRFVRVEATEKQEIEREAVDIEGIALQETNQEGKA